MNRLIKRATNGSTSRVAGTWFYEEYQDGKDGEYVVCVCCPNCGGASALIDHAIDEHGQVEPSVVCTHCHDFEDHIKLEGYKP